MNKDWLDIDVLEDYLEGKLDAKSMNRVERAALEDPFVAEALAGLSISPKHSLASMSLLQKQLQSRIAEQDKVKKTSIITWQRLSIAATAAVLFISVGIIFWMKQANYEQAAGKEKKVDVNLAPMVAEERADSVIDNAAAAITKSDETYAVVQHKRTKSVVRSPEVMNSKMNEPLQGGDSIAKDSKPATLDEVVVVGAGTQKRSSIVGSVTTFNARENEEKYPLLAANPLNGWDNFYNYIDSNSVFKDQPKTGRYLQLSFAIGRDGSPRKIKFLNKLEKKYNREALRLLSEGPKWTVPENSSTRITIKISF